MQQAHSQKLRHTCHFPHGQNLVGNSKFSGLIDFFGFYSLILLFYLIDWSLAIIGPLIPGFIIVMNSWITMTLYTIVCMCVIQNGDRRVTELEVFKEAFLKMRTGS